MIAIVILIVIVIVLVIGMTSIIIIIPGGGCLKFEAMEYPAGTSPMYLTTVVPFPPGFKSYIILLAVDLLLICQFLVVLLPFTFYSIMWWRNSRRTSLALHFWGEDGYNQSSAHCSFLTTNYLGLSENGVPLNPMVNDHYPY